MCTAKAKNEARDDSMLLLGPDSDVVLTLLKSIKP